MDPTTHGTLTKAKTGRVDGAVATETGPIRPTNQDAIILWSPEDPERRERDGVLLVVADGMGGHAGGEVASRLAVETVTGMYAIDNADPGAALVRAVRLANRAIYEAAIREPHYLGMGTTCTALLLRQGFAYCAHVGDSRLYLIRDDAALRLTDDHSAVFDLITRGLIKPEEARHHPDRHLLVRALGTRGDVQVDSWPEPLYVRLGDRFLVSSDGLHDAVSDEEIVSAARRQSPIDACRELVTAALARGGRDNISVGILQLDRPNPLQPAH